MIHDAGCRIDTIGESRPFVLLAETKDDFMLHPRLSCIVYQAINILSTI